jgi:hypothetical protein
MASNTNINITELDFTNIKSNFINYLKTQDTFKDYNFAGSTMSTLLDVLAYNTQYNAYYLNMVANEMFLDSAIQRSSVVSHAKLLNYVPKSAVAPTAEINITFNGVSNTSFTLPKFTNFMSSAVNGVNYNFVTINSNTVNTVANTATFNNVIVKQGISTIYTYTVDSTSNPTYTYQIPDANIDTTTLQVRIQQSSSNTALTVFQSASNYLTLNGDSPVYFLQEAINGNYEIYFGDGVLGQKLSDGNIIYISYISTDGTTAFPNSTTTNNLINFTLMDSLTGFTSQSITTVFNPTQGSAKESISSIKFQAPKSFSAQGRAVSKNDYITAIQQNTLGFPIDAVNVWGGEENTPPVYGQVFVAVKPAGAYFLTNSQKQRLIAEVIKPISVMTVTPNIIDPDYTYLQLDVSVYYDSTKTTLTSDEIKSGVTTTIQNYGTNNLNTFNSTFDTYTLLKSIQNYNPSIITSEFSLKLQKKFMPVLLNSSTIKLYYNTSLQAGKFGSGITSYPSMQFLDPTNLTSIIDGVYIEEVPSSTYGVDTVSIINPGFGYQSTPTLTILGDGVGATATPTIVNGSIQSVTVTNSGNNYTQAVATITPAAGDTTGRLGAVLVNLKGRYGTLRTYYYNGNNVKVILNSNIGTVDYVNGIVTLNDFNPYNINNPLGQLSLSVTPTTNIVSSTYDRIITIDPYDPNAVNVNVTAKTVK